MRSIVVLKSGFFQVLVIHQDMAQIRVVVAIIYLQRHVVNVEGRGNSSANPRRTWGRDKDKRHTAVADSFNGMG